MTILTYLQIEFIPFLTLVLTLHLSTAEYMAVRNVRRFRLMVALVMGILVVDAFDWYTVLHPLAFPAALLWCSNILYFLLSEIIAFLWFQYVVHQVCGQSLTPRQQRWLRLSVIPLLITCAVILTSPWNRLIFTIDPLDHSYARGALHAIQTVAGFAYMLLASVIAWLRSRKVTLTEEKKECRFLCRIVILPLLGGLLQIYNYYLVFLWSFTAAAAFLIYMDFQSHWVSVDPLTSLNNRGSLEQYLQAAEREQRLRGWLMMMDIDHFKTINDRFGHIEGDRALRITAQALKSVFGASGAFLSRYGGDEFVVIAEPDDLEAMLRRCEEELARIVREKNLPYELRLSVGCAHCVLEGSSPRNLLQLADQRMYQRKRAAGGCRR